MGTKNDLFSLFENIKSIINEIRADIVRNINQAMVFAYFQIGKMIVEHEQQGNSRADYAKETISKLSQELNREFGKGYSVSNLEYMRIFYLTYRTRIPQAWSGELNQSTKSQTLSGKFKIPFKLGWSHYVLLSTVKNENERNFYEI